MDDREFKRLIEKSSLGTPTAKRYRREWGLIRRNQKRIDEAAAYEREQARKNRKGDNDDDST